MKTDNKIKRLMFITVGVGGTNGEDIAHALLYTIKHCNPDNAVFLASEESWNKISVHLLPKLEEWKAGLNPAKEIITEIDDFEFLHNHFSQIIKNYLDEGYQKENIIADYTSGTKAMSAAMVSSAIFNKIDTLTYVTGKREKGRVISGTERQYPLSTLSIISKQIINEAIEYFNKGMFYSTIQKLTTSPIYPSHKMTADTLVCLSKSFDCWDKFDFTNAFELIKNLSEEMLLEFQLKSKFNKVYRPLLVKLKEDTLSYEKVDDLLFNASRRSNEGKYDDAVARIYRAVEMLGQIEFKKEFNCATSNIISENLDQKLADFIKANTSKNDKGEIQAALFNTFKILAFVNNSYGKLFTDNFSEIRKLMDSRNNSILAHGSIPIAEEQFGKFYSIITETFSLADKGDRNPDFKFPEITEVNL